ncbi:Uncharacterised protein [Vibrio cholerae]|nr:Uncharacterised protein [Vibrio cholerae]
MNEDANRKNLPARALVRCGSVDKTAPNPVQNPTGRRGYPNRHWKHDVPHAANYLALGIAGSQSLWPDSLACIH